MRNLWIFWCMRDCVQLFRIVTLPTSQANIKPRGSNLRLSNSVGLISVWLIEVCLNQIVAFVFKLDFMRVSYVIGVWASANGQLFWYRAAHSRNGRAVRAIHLNWGDQVDAFEEGWRLRTRFGMPRGSRSNRGALLEVIVCKPLRRSGIKISSATLQLSVFIPCGCWANLWSFVPSLFFVYRWVFVPFFSWLRSTRCMFTLAQSRSAY